MTAFQRTQITDALERAKQSFHRLVLLIGPSATGKTLLLRELAEYQDCASLNVNLEVSQRMLDVPKSKRPLHAERIFADLIAGATGDFLILDNLEILFDPALRLDPLRLLQIASRNQSMVASWNGTLDNGLLTYAEPEHPEYKSYRNVDAVTVLAGNMSTTSH